MSHWFCSYLLDFSLKFCRHFLNSFQTTWVHIKCVIFALWFPNYVVLVLHSFSWRIYLLISFQKFVLKFPKLVIKMWLSCLNFLFLEVWLSTCRNNQSLEQNDALEVHRATEAWFIIQLNIIRVQPLPRKLRNLFHHCVTKFYFLASMPQFCLPEDKGPRLFWTLFSLTLTLYLVTGALRYSHGSKYKLCGRLQSIRLAEGGTCNIF